MSDRANTQLRLLVEFAEALWAAGVRCWLRGGWAVDFAVGEITRSHEDVDFFVRSEDADQMDRALRACGYVRTPGPPPERQRNYVREGEEFHVALITQDETGTLRSPGVADWAWPAGTLGTAWGRLGEFVLLIVPPSVQIELKEIGLERIPQHRHRDKHLGDVARLRAIVRRTPT